jgi:hypothetical protein
MIHKDVRIHQGDLRGADFGSRPIYEIVTTALVHKSTKMAVD